MLSENPDKTENGKQDPAAEMDTSIFGHHRAWAFWGWFVKNIEWYQFEISVDPCEPEFDLSARL